MIHRNVFDNIIELKKKIKEEESLLLKNNFFYKALKNATDPEDVEFRKSCFSEYFNNEAKDTFIIKRLKSGRFSLKPNLADKFFLYRGENTFHDFSTSSIFRDVKRSEFLDYNIKINEFCLLLFSHPLVQMFSNGIEINGHKFVFEVNYYALAQHYLYHSALMDFTSEFEIAAFFASTETKDGISYSPFQNEDIGCIYCYNIIIPSSFKLDKMRTVGLQVFPRTAAQKGFVMELNMRENMNHNPYLDIYLFRHNKSISEQIYNNYNRGFDLFPMDELAMLSEEIRCSKDIPHEAFDLNCSLNPNNDRENNSLFLQKIGYNICDKPVIKFTKKDLKLYYQTIQNGGWEKFCDRLYFPYGDSNTFVEQLKQIRYKPDYQEFFEECDYNTENIEGRYKQLRDSFIRDRCFMK